MKSGDDTEGLQIALMRWATRSHSSAGLAGWDPYRLGPWLAGFMAGLRTRRRAWGTMRGAANDG